MATNSPPVDPYRRRREAGNASREETRARLLAAADALFREQGYAATTVAAIATRAEVSLQTLYLAWGSKRALLLAAGNAAAVAADSPIEPAEWHTKIRAELAVDIGDDPTAAEYISAIARLFTRVAGRAGPYWRMLQLAASTDPDLKTDWDVVIAGRRQTMTAVAAGLPQRGRRPGLTHQTVADTLWALASPEMFHLLSTDGDYTPTSFAAWLERTLIAALCADQVPERAEPTCAWDSCS